VTGANFISGSEVLWNNSQVSTTFVSSTSLTAQIPASDLSAAGTANVTVQTPAPGGGTSSALTFTINAPTNPAPTVTSISPSSATAAGPAFTLTVTGANFISGSEVLWNGGQVSTTFVSSTSLTAQIPASDLASAGTASIAVQNPAPGGGLSGGLTFTVNPSSSNLNLLNVLDVEGIDVVWNSSQQVLYVAVPSTATTNASTISVVDPIAGTVTSTQQLSSAASGLAISDDNQFLYAVVSGGNAIQRFTLPALTPDIEWSLGTSPLFGADFLAGDIKVQPGASHTLAVSMGQYGSDYAAVFDDGVERPTVAGSLDGMLGNSLQWKPDGSQLYAALTFAIDSGGFTAPQSISLYSMPVSQTGVGTPTDYEYTFRVESARLHSDPTTNYIYSDSGEVINPANGVPIGNFRYSRPKAITVPGPLSVVDPTLGRFYTLQQVTAPDNTPAFQILAFDQANFQLLNTIVIQNAVGTPANFIRWGQSGLAVVTSGSGTTPGKLYILDGTFVNPSGTQDTALGTDISPVPTLTAISPLTATVGGQAVTLTLTGRDFVGQPTVYWNGNALQTTLVNSSELSAQIPASDLTSAVQAPITVSNTASPFPASSAFTFSVNPAAPAGTRIAVYNAGGYDLLWDAATAKIYVSMPGVQGDAGDAIGIVDPVAGTVTSSGFLGSDPAKLALSSDSNYLYLALNGANAIQQLALPSLKVNTEWTLGGEGDSESPYLANLGPYYAMDLQAAPGAPQTTAIILAGFFETIPEDVAVYDGSTPRTSELEAGQNPYSALQWAGTDSTLYAVNQFDPASFMVFGVGASGPVLNQTYDGILSGYAGGIHYDPGKGIVYTDSGQVIQPTSGTVVGSFGASGIAAPDSTLDRVFILGQSPAQAGTQNYTIESFDQAKFTAIGSIAIDNVVGTPTALIRWGTNGLAFTTMVGTPTNFLGTGPGQVYVISGDYVTQAANSSQSSRTEPMSPVQRTWGLESGSKHQPPSNAANSSPLRQ
jgi:hypothetical protein